MKILPLTEKEIDAVIKLDESFSDGWNKEMFSSGLKNGLKLFGLFGDIDEELKGYISYDVFLEFADIETVLIKKTERRKGYGYALVLFALSEIEKSGIEKIFLEVRESNFNAIALYEKLGFKRINERKKYYPDGETALVYLRSEK